MKIYLKISELAAEDIESYLQNSKKTPNNLKKYYDSLIDSINLLIYYPNLGKVSYIDKNYQFRRLIHKEHHILYLVKDNEIVISALIHVKYPINQSLSFLKKYI